MEESTTTQPQMDLATLLERVEDSIPASDVPVIKRAYQMAAQAHDGQSRASGEPFVQHSLATAITLADLRLDTATIAAALLHDKLGSLPQIVA